MASYSKSQEMEHTVQQLLNILKCPVCLTAMDTTIWQCNGGHYFCDKCHPQLKTCPVCRALLCNVRSLGMEKIRDVLWKSGRYSGNECRQETVLPEEKEHDTYSSDQMLKCPSFSWNCDWEGPVHDSQRHIQKQHSCMINGQGCAVEFCIPVADGIRSSLLQMCYGNIFRASAVCDSDQQCIFCHMQLLGTEKEAQKFRYQAKVYFETQNYTYSNEVNSVLKEEEVVFCKGKCLIIPFSALWNLGKAKDDLKIQLEIVKSG